MKTKIILEMCANHNGEMKLAKAMIDEAAELGVYGVKFQKRNIDCIPDTFTNPFLEKKHMFGNTWKEHCRFLEFDLSEIEELKSYAESKKLEFSCTAFDVQSIKDLISIGVTHIKLPSQLYLDKECYLELTGKNIYVTVSTGMHTWSEIINGAWFYEADMVYYCLSRYPCSSRDINLNALVTMSTFRKKVGYSSHELRGTGIPFAIVAGATRIERHYTLDIDMKGADHYSVSSDKKGMYDITANIRHLEEMMGGKEKILSEDEKKVAEVFRCS